MDAISSQRSSVEVPTQETSRRAFEGRPAPPAPSYTPSPEFTQKTQETQVEEPQPRARIPILAVRVGPAPVVATGTSVDVAIREALAQRATLIRIAEVLTLDTPDTGPRPDVRLLGDGSRRQEVDVPLPGEGRFERPSTQQAAPPSGAGRLISTAARGARAEDHSRAELRAERELGRQHAQVDQVIRESGNRASEVAPSTGAVQDSHQSRAVTSEAKAESAGQAVATREFTQAASVEAQRNDAIVTRFFRGTNTEQPGATPHVREELGERSVPISSYA